MKQLTPKPTDAFIHIPKTAGQSLRAELLHHWGERRCRSVYLDEEKADLCKEATNNPDRLAQTVAMVYGHQFYGIHEIWPGPIHYLTMLREPVDRLLSYYYNAQDTRRNRTPQGKLAREAKNFVAFAVAAPYVCNAQSILLAGKPNWIHTSGSSFLRRPATSSTVREAIRHLADCTWFGLQGRYEQSVRSLRSLMCWPNREVQPRLNTTPGRPETSSLPAAVRQELEAHCWADVELYKAAETLWLSRYGDA